MMKKFLTIALTLTLGLTACQKEDDSLCLPQSGIKMDKGILSAYPEKEIAANGLVALPEITEISPKVFEGYKTLKSVEAPKLTKIGSAAFKGSALTSLTLGATVPDADEDAFAETSAEKNLVVPADKVADFAPFAIKHGFKTINGAATPGTEIEIKDGVLIAYPLAKIPEDGVVTLAPEVKEIAANVFEGNTKLKEIHAPGIKKIGAAAFKNCSALMKVDFGGEQLPPQALDENDKEYGTAEDAFWGTPEDKVLVFKESNQPNYMRYFEFIARHHFAKLDGIEIPANLSSGYTVKNGVLTAIKDNNALAGRGRNGVLILPSSVKKIGDGVFSKRFQNFKAIYGEGVEAIENNAFLECYSLQFVHFPKLKSIGEQAFTDNGKLEALNFPNLETIGELAFNSYGAVNPIRITYLSMPHVKRIGKGVLEGRYEKPITLLLGSQPEVDFTAYKDDMPQDGSVTFHGMISPVLYVTPADKASYTLTDGKWHGFTIKEKK